jgi:hypothetical protein
MRLVLAVFLAMLAATFADGQVAGLPGEAFRRIDKDGNGKLSA